MIKIKSIKFKDHKILGKKLELDFCDKDGNPADTIIIAGENGTGKTTILEEIEKILTYQFSENVIYTIINNDDIFKYDNKKFWKNNDEISYPFKVGTDFKKIFEDDFKEFKNLSNFLAPLYATVNINFSPNTKIKKIGGDNTDINDDERKKFTDKTAENIKQLFADIINYDYKIKAEKYDEISENIKQSKVKIEKVIKKIQNEINTNLLLKMNRFKKVFNNKMFEGLEFEGIDNIDGNIEILFKKNGEKISIDDLSSGEKQIVFRGAFLLRDKNALNGAVVLIDEPEISMHPKWQEKILGYYRDLFVDNDKKQTSQIIVSTHSNFVIENALKLDNFVIVALQENNQPKKIMKNDGTFILPSVTAAEINYHVFDIVSIDYHIQLFGYFQSLMEDELSDKNGEKINMSINDVDNKIKSLLSEKVLQDSQGNACKWIHSFVDKKGNPRTTIYNTICCFIRNAIDHPENLPNQNKKEYTKADLRYSIEILIELINLAKQNRLN
ncbi:ATP-binding protein [Campylobacter sp. VBCF_05 NA6]|uniref:AAA family ATPase n=1 Tax=unclassified Campylobacter TaxID=2593542 RepID=UPI0022E9EED7|nr:MULTISPECIES: ATP-binding protein [unclassified Campylobacter]MDA3057336.1 ATP-binding protein [Campylobacter sp. VBCF_04 NA7]MDA3059092.1 ATP-binding protein [Campylobacter sp. VBCF_05 NA6]